MPTPPGLSTGWNWDDVHVLDPRPSLDYNRGHLPGAVNVPLERLLDERGALLPDEALGAVFGEAGVDESKRSLVYDGADGRRGALMAWTLEYLGRGEVSLSALLFEGWAQQGLPRFRPARDPPPPANSTSTSTPTSGPPVQELEAPNPPRLLDLRSPAGIQRLRQSRLPGRLQPALDRVSWSTTTMLLRPDSDLARRLSNLGHRTNGQSSHLLHNRRTRRHRLPGPQASRLRRSRPTQPPLAHPLPCPRGCGDPSPSHAPIRYSTSSSVLSASRACPGEDGGRNSSFSTYMSF